ncbi:CYFA0S01e04786g1_1 [Cyberlindnera fabianii]|uniref:CYFA0S01e04786g1_1 n=1 Tax=Cyberlindnera fabianii TaxID=36022 RepID=A0A061AN83_CYBFA|nr:CYFA0S01e04786g1_1 [Cyberlindnera fabianii]
MSDILNLEKQLVFYRSYHYNTVNVLIHSVFVPTILFTSIGILTPIKLSKDANPFFNLATLMTIGYAGFYLLLDVTAGLITTPILYLFLKTNVDGTQYVDGWFGYMVWIFIIAWIVQFIGHGVFEKRAPALLDNLVQALVLAPYFVLFEGLFLIGWRKDLKQRIDTNAASNIALWKEKKSVK